MEGLQKYVTPTNERCVRIFSSANLQEGSATLRLQLITRVAFCLATLAGVAVAQAPPVSITLQDAIARARQHAGQLQGANFAALQAREDARQARAGRLPTLNALNQGLYTKGNGTPEGVFITNNGVHVYTEQALVHQDLLAVVRKGEVRRAAALEAAARARVDVASRGLNTVVIQNYYGVVGAARRFTNAQLSLREAEQFVDITEKQERGGEAAHADVVKARLLLQQRQRDLQDSQVVIEKAKIGLGVLIFPSFSTDFNVADDAGETAVMPAANDVRTQAGSSSPDLRVARSLLAAAGQEVSVARYGYLPAFSVDLNYGIDANRFAFRGGVEDPQRQNLGYSVQLSLNVPVWNWGITQSRVRQAELRRAEAQLQLTLAGRALEANLAAALAEARGALQQLESLRSTVDLATEGLRLTLLRYQAGEAVTLEVVDAQSTLTLARNGFDDGQVRYKAALANLQTLTGAL
ncbi:MAG: outer rane efflux protein [Bryobacterales bacterium]|nr:outer rane efflux protein [Bryobacterales bacterium]